MSNAKPLIRLNQIYYGERKNLLAADWYFSVLGLGSEDRRQLVKRAMAVLEAAYGDKTLVLDDRLYQSRGAKIKKAGQGFALTPEGLLLWRLAQTPTKAAADVALDFILELETTLRGELKVQVEMFKVLDFLVRLVLQDDRHGRFDCVTSGARATFENHAIAVREVWEQYLPAFLLDSPRRSGLECPDLLAEVLLEADFLTALMLLNILAHHPRSLNLPLKITLAGAISLFPTKQIEPTLAALVDRGWLVGYEKPRVVSPAIRTRYYETVVTLGDGLKDLINHPLPDF
jgi:hypothetical protein